MYEKFARQQNSPVEDVLSGQGRDDIKRVEGILIESFRKKYGHFPPWNNIGGSTLLLAAFITSNYFFFGDVRHIPK